MKKILFAAALFCSLAVAACGGDDDDAPAVSDNIQCSPEAVDLPATGGTATVSINANHEWGATATETWVTLDKSSATGQQTTIVVSASPIPPPRRARPS